MESKPTAGIALTAIIFTVVVAWAINVFGGIEWPYCMWMAVLIDIALWALSKLRSHG